MRMGFFPGCSLEGSAREYAESLRAIVEGAKAVPAELIQLVPSLAGKVSSIKISAIKE